MRSMGSDTVETELSTPLFQMWSLCHPCEDPGANSPCRIVGCLSSTYQKICKWRFRVLVLKFSCVYVTVSILKSLKETKNRENMSKIEEREGETCSEGERKERAGGKRRERKRGKKEGEKGGTVRIWSPPRHWHLDWIIHGCRDNPVCHRMLSHRRSPLPIRCQQPPPATSCDSQKGFQTTECPSIPEEDHSWLRTSHLH